MTALLKLSLRKRGGGLIAFEHTGEFKWKTSVNLSVGWGGAAIADLDGDGNTEIIIGNTALNADGSLLWQGNGFRGNNGVGPLSVVADINLDGKPEVIAGATAYSNTGELLWQNKNVGDGFVAIGNFNDDQFPEIVIVSSGRVFLLNHSGKIIWGPVSIPGGGGGGAPTIADMDGDGISEIGIAGGQRYVVFKADGKVLWTAVTVDSSSHRTGSSVFDFDGDGQVEVVYADQQYLRVYRGIDGSVVFQTPNTSGTTYELPIIVDVDNDNHSDIVLCTNNYAFRGSTGIRVFQDKHNTWLNTRKIWNQHSYHVTNINDDGTVPTVEENSWQVHNTYRLNRQTSLDLSKRAAPDLTSSQLQYTPGESSHLTVRIGNGGIAPSAETLLGFYNGHPKEGGTLIDSITVNSLKPGTYQDVVLEEVKNLPEGQIELYGFVDANEQVPECNETNNFVSQTIVRCKAFGKLVDKQNNPIEGVTIQVGDRTVVTDSTGYWKINALPEDNYTLTASKQGYQFDSKDFFVGPQECAVDLGKSKGTSLLKIKQIPHTWQAVKQGENITYRIIITNEGNETATGVRFQNVLPLETHLVSITARDGGHCDTSTVSCDLPDLTSGATTEIELVVSNTQTETLLNTATVVADQYPPELAKTWSTVKPYLSVSITDSPDPVTMEGLLHQTLAVELSHYAPSDATGIELVSQLPKGVELQSVETDHGTCDSSQLPTIKCSLTDLSVDKPDKVSHVTVNLDMLLKDPGLLLLTQEASVTASEYPTHTDRERTKVFVDPSVKIDLIFVIDDSNSMQEEINGVIKAVAAFIDEIDSSKAPFIALVTFKDDVVVKAASRNPEVVKEAIQKLKVSGGGQCPEASAEALDIAIKHVKDDGVILLATDASPYSDADIAGLVERLRSKGVRLNVLLTGDCTDKSAWNGVPD